MTQSQREALLDLLIAAIFVDSQLSIKEDEALDYAFQSIGWDGVNPRHVFICSSMTRARRVRDSDEATARYINSRVTVFADEDSRSMAIDLLERVFVADGLAESEAEFLARVKACFS